jgi:pyridoxal phosphate enzyme (YggS family)
MLAPQQVAENISRIRSRLDELSSQHVGLIAVTKTWPRVAMEMATRAGADGLGENYAQELISKVGEGRADLAPVHFIGGLQSNKVRMLVSHVDIWQSIDRSSLLTELGSRYRTWRDADPTVARPRVFLQVNTTGEAGKSGCDPADLDDLRAAAVAADCEVLGLMTVGPTNSNPADTEAAFRLLRSLMDQHGLRECSMGMTGDYERATALGSTMVRIGSAIFGSRL